MWGCLAKVGIPDPQRTKIGPKTVDFNNFICISYAQNRAAYRFILVHENSVFGAIGESRDAEFFGNEFPMKFCASRMLPGDC